MHARRFLARAYAALGRAELAVSHARQWIALASPETDLGRRNRRELALATLLRTPSGVTVPMLKTDPTWDNVRDDIIDDYPPYDDSRRCGPNCVVEC